MKKTGLILVLAMALMVSLTITTMAEPGLEVGLGYSFLDSSSTINLYDLNLLEASDSCKMYTLSLDYGVNDWLSFSGKYSSGDSTLFSIIGIPVTQDTQIWQFEGALQWSVGDKTKIGAVLGYLDYETTSSILPIQLTSNISGAYIGPIVTYTPNDNWEFGAAYRYMFNADGELALSILGSTDLEDASYATAEIYGKTYLSDNWTLKVAYTYTSLDWTPSELEIINIERDMSGLSVALGYKF